jgi:hypothetical protein
MGKLRKKRKKIRQEYGGSKKAYREAKRMERRKGRGERKAAKLQAQAEALEGVMPEYEAPDALKTYDVPQQYSDPKAAMADVLTMQKQAGMQDIGEAVKAQEADIYRQGRQIERAGAAKAEQMGIGDTGASLGGYKAAQQEALLPSLAQAKQWGLSVGDQRARDALTMGLSLAGQKSQYGLDVNKLQQQQALSEYQTGADMASSQYQADLAPWNTAMAQQQAQQQRRQALGGAMLGLTGQVAGGWMGLAGDKAQAAAGASK